MNTQQIQELTTIEAQLLTLLAALPASEIRAKLKTAKRALHSVICQSLETVEQ
jgi:hypothetical protein